MIYAFVIFAVLHLLLLSALVYERFSNRRFKRQQSAPPIVKAVPLHPDALRTRSLKKG